MKSSTIPTFALLALVTACGTSDTPADADAGGESSSGSTSGSSSSSTSSGSTAPDSGKCQIVTAGPNVGTVLKSVSRGTGTVPWTDLDGAKDVDDTFAKTVLAAGEESEELQITGFGFDLPEGVVFQGVEVQLKRQAPDGGIADGQIALVGVQNQVGRGKFIASPWPTSIVGTHHYGQATDTWGMDLNPPDVERPEFGVALWVKRADGPVSATALVESIRVRVFYCL